ncbi:MAG: chemotaxis protein CheA [Deltaproteobacteria bacterium]|nr:chemotaxis protein CheA [Deltaproteobacteria bacterium]
MQPDRVTPEVQDLLPDYLLDARECLEKVSGVLLALDRGDVDPDFVAELFRQMHIIKGGAGLMGFASIGKVAHAAEDLLGAAKRGTLELGPAVTPVLLEAHDALRTMMDELESDGATATAPVDVVGRLEALLRGETVAPLPSVAAAAEVAEAPDADAHKSEHEENEEVLREFFLESGELVDELDQDLVTLEENPEDKDLLNKIFRAAHTLKGSSSFLGFSDISGVTHHVEDIFNKLRKDEMRLNPETMDVILEAVDRVKRLLGAAQAGEPRPPVDDLIVALSEAVKGGEPRRLGDILSEDEGVSAKLIEETLHGKSRDKPLGQALVEDAGVAPEVVERSLAKQSHQKGPAQTEQTVRVDVERLDALLNLVGELVLGKNRLSRLRTQMEERWEGDAVLEELGETAAQIDLVASDLQMAVMKTRLVAIDKVFRKFPRMVRDLARSLKKEIRLEIRGEGTELDKSVVEIIGDPLVHLIRNSADHGVEAPDVRVKAGKPREGRIRLSARHEGNHIVVSVEDDGKGMDPEVLKRKALEKGIITPAEAASMSVRDALHLIFAPGFSTAAQVTSVSGRGVGMDVVKTNIQQVNGVVEIDSTFGVGSRVEVKIPLTLAIIQALLVCSGREVYAVPLVSVIETVRVEPGDVKTVDQFPVLRLRDQVLPLLNLRELFKVPTVPGVEEDARKYVVVLGIAEKRVGLVVDSLVGEEEVVIKNLGTYLTEVPGIAGATIRGDGRVTLIMDVSQLMDLATRAAAARGTKAAA